MRITRNNICSEIKRHTGWDVKIYAANGYFFFYSDDTATELKLVSWQSTSVYSNRLTHMSVDRWVDTFIDMILDNL